MLPVTSTAAPWCTYILGQVYFHSSPLVYLHTGAGAPTCSSPLVYLHTGAGAPKFYNFSCCLLLPLTACCCCCCHSLPVAAADASGYPPGYPVFIDGGLGQGRTQGVLSFLSDGKYLAASKHRGLLELVWVGMDCSCHMVLTDSCDKV